MNMLVQLHNVRCPTCSRVERLTETTLQHIAQGHLEARGDREPLRFVCQQCKTGFEYDWVHTPADGVIEVPAQILGSPKVAFVICDCEERNCDEKTEVAAVRPDYNADQFARELSSWDLSALRCFRHHKLIRPPRLNTQRAFRR